LPIESLKRGNSHAGIYQHILNFLWANNDHIPLRHRWVSGERRKQRP
jgi:hypothetical protein